METKIELKKEILSSALKYSRESADLILNQMDDLGTIEEKQNPFDLVTSVDKMIDQFLVQRIREDFPDHWVLSEEENAGVNPYDALRKKGLGFGWIIDPIDGTTNFIHGIPHFAISIGIVRDFEPYIGVVYNPMTKDFVIGL